MSGQEGAILVTPRSFRRMEGEHWDKLRDSSFEVIRSPHQDELMTEEEMQDYVKNENIRAVIVGLDPLTEKVLQSADSLEVISKYGTGLDNIDLETAKEEGITVTYTPGANTQSVADLTMGLLLSAARWITYHDRKLREGQLVRNKGQEIWDKKMGIVGLGQIGTAVARRARGFNTETLYYDIERWETTELALGVKFRSLDDLITESDFITLHCPLNESTRDLIGRSELREMKEESILINTSRAGLVDEAALAEALKSDKIAGAAVDTFESEDELSTELLQLDNFVASPHAGASTKESVLRMANMATEEVINTLNGKGPAHQVPALS